MNKHSQVVSSSGSHRLACLVCLSALMASVAIGVMGANVRRVRQLGDDISNGINQMNTADEQSSNSADWLSSGRSNQRQPTDIASAAASSAAAAASNSFVDNLMGNRQPSGGSSSGAAAESVAVSSSGSGSMWPFGPSTGNQQQSQQGGSGGFGNFGNFGSFTGGQQQAGKEDKSPHGQHGSQKGFTMNDMSKYVSNPMELVNAISHQFGIPREKIVEQLGGRFSFNMDTMLNPMVATIKVIEKTFVPDACRLRFFCQVGTQFSPHLRQHLGRISPQTLGGSAHVKALSQGISGSDCNLTFETCEPKLKKQFEVLQNNQQGNGQQGSGQEGGYEDQSGGSSSGTGGGNY